MVGRALQPGIWVLVIPAHVATEAAVQATDCPMLFVHNTGAARLLIQVTGNPLVIGVQLGLAGVGIVASSDPKHGRSRRVSGHLHSKRDRRSLVRTKIKGGYGLVALRGVVDQRTACS